MTETAWPFDSGNVNETQWSRMTRVWGGSGVVGYPGGTSAQVYADSSGMQVKIRDGQAQVRGHHWSSDAIVTKSIGANATDNPRIDRVVLRLDPSANSLVLAVVQGTAAATPVAPALTQTDTGVYEMPLASVTVGSGATSIASGDVAEERPFLPDRGAPTGTVQMFASLTPPAGWLICDGSAVSRNTYQQLFAVIGTSFGIGNGATTFNLPDMRGRSPVGYDSSQPEFDALNDSGGAKTKTLTTSEMPSHTHSGTTNTSLVPTQFSSSDGGTATVRRGSGTYSGGTLNDSWHAHSFTTNATGSGVPFSILNPFRTMQFIIKT